MIHGITYRTGCSSKFTVESSEQDYENVERESKLDLNELFEDGQRLLKEDKLELTEVKN